MTATDFIKNKLHQESGTVKLTIKCLEAWLDEYAEQKSPEFQEIKHRIKKELIEFYSFRFGKLHAEETINDYLRIKGL